MTTQHFFTTQWYWDPFAMGVCVVALAAGWWFETAPSRLTRQAFGPVSAGKAPGGLAVARRSPGQGARLLLAGLGILVLALLSPVATLARYYLFSAHMLQHLMLLLIAPPLFLLGIVKSRPATSAPSVQASTAGVSGWIPASWLAGVGAMWLWHVPALCNAASSKPWVYHLQSLSLLALGLAFWRPIVDTRAPGRLSPPGGIAYLVSACFACTLLGIYITFAPVSVCSIYCHPADPLGILPLVRSRWGMSAELDQQAGGLLMWVPACLIYLTGVLGLLARWFSDATDSLSEPRPLPQPLH